MGTMQMLTVGQAAEVLGRHANTIRNYAREGKLTAHRDYNNYRLFDPTEVEDLRREIEKVEPERESAHAKELKGEEGFLKKRGENG
jgi:excisionase family DNA binding protein